MKLHALMMVAALAAAGSTLAQTPDNAPPPDRQAARAAMMQACSADIQSMCADKQGREMMMCLRGNAPKLSPGCSDAMAKMPMRPPGGAPPAQ
jgi:cytochrome c556